MPRVTMGGMRSDGTRFSNEDRFIDALPNDCPICHMKIVPDSISPGFETLNRLELYFRCTNSKCLRSFISICATDPERSKNQRESCYTLSRSVPVEPKDKIVADVVKAVSPSFVAIWMQAQSAEDHGLDEVAGPGFRKALEFLIKDYAISLTEVEKDITAIKASPLQSVIKTYLPGDKLSVVSSRATWLGNDETHYERRWTGKNLKDLKALIEATEHFIAMEKLVESIPIEMPDPKATSPSLGKAAS